MRRDMDLVRKILLALEAYPHGYAPVPFVIEGHDEETVGYHVYLMEQGNLLRIVDLTSTRSLSPKAQPTSLTWQGHEFLDNARNETVWNQAKRIVMDRGGTVSFEILKELVMQITRSQFLPGG